MERSSRGPPSPVARRLRRVHRSSRVSAEHLGKETEKSGTPRSAEHLGKETEKFPSFLPRYAEHLGKETEKSGGFWFPCTWRD